MPPGTRDLVILVGVVAAAFLLLCGYGYTRTWWQDRPKRRAQREWKQHCDQAIRLANDTTWPDGFRFAKPVTRESIRAAHEQELVEGSRNRHPAFKNRGDQ